jgi:hypothetical protein
MLAQTFLNANAFFTEHEAAAMVLLAMQLC